MAKRPRKPEFYSKFMEKNFFPGANKIIKYQESHNYWIFKTGKKIYKVKKQEDIQSTVSLEEIFCQEMVRRLKTYSPDLQVELATVKNNQQGYQLDRDGNLSSPALYYVIIMNQLTNRYFLSNIIDKGKLTEKTMDRISLFLVQLHAAAETSSSKNEGTSDSLLQKLNDLIYQSKKYLGITITQPMIDMTYRPLEKYIVDNRKLLLRRVKKGYIKEVHGCFIPRKIYAGNDGILALAKSTDPLRDRFCDIASDIADLAVQLIYTGNHSMADYFIEAYCKQADDQETRSIIPIYQALNCLTQGLKYSISFNQSEAEEEKKSNCLL